MQWLISAGSVTITVSPFSPESSDDEEARAFMTLTLSVVSCML